MTLQQIINLRQQLSLFIGAQERLSFDDKGSSVIVEISSDNTTPQLSYELEEVLRGLGYLTLAWKDAASYELILANSPHVKIGMLDDGEYLQYLYLKG